MSGGVAPLASIALRDGSRLQVAADGVHHGDRVIPLAKIQDARVVSPNPEAIALRVAGMGLLEFEPEHAGDGAAALEKLFQLRPDLRPAGFGSPAETVPLVSYPGAPLYTGAGSMPGSPLTFSPVPAMGYAESRAMTERRARGLLTPVPRGFFEAVAAILALYGGKLRFWLLLGLAVTPVAGILDAGFSYLLFSRILQASPTQTVLSTSNCFLPALQLETGATLVRDAAGAAGLLVLSLLVTAFQTALMGIAAREAALDHPVSVKRSYRAALQRWWPTLGASFLAGAPYYLALLPAVACYGYAYATASGLNLCQGSSAANTALTVGFLGSVFLIIGVVLAILFAVRLGLAPYVAATSNAGARRAIAQSWQLTRGHFWRAFGLILVTGVAAWFVLQIAASFPPVVALFIATPIAYLLVVPFIALTYTLLLYDLWLRHDGYAALTQELSAVASTPPASVPPLG